MATLVTPVTNPLPLTVTCGTVIESPKVPTSELTVSNVNTKSTLEVPSNETLGASPSPEILKFLAVANAVAVSAFPVIAPINVLA